jgi:periplasmic protein TonB
VRRPRAALAALLAAAAAAVAPAAARAGAPEEARAEVGVARVAYEDAAPRGPGVEERLAQIRQRIQAALVYPPLARLHRLEGEARVQFAIAPDGRPAELAVAGSAGHAILDRAALAAVEGAAPLPWVYGRLEVPVRFELGATRR